MPSMPKSKRASSVPGSSTQAMAVDDGADGEFFAENLLHGGEVGDGFCVQFAARHELRRDLDMGGDFAPQFVVEQALEDDRHHDQREGLNQRHTQSHLKQQAVAESDLHGSGLGVEPCVRRLRTK